jgi:hypothetical protein
MPYIIDGHNLIHYLDDIQLDDPHDEAKLVLKLRGFCARTRKKCVVIFDEGLPGGISSLSTPSVKVVFASSRQSDADRIIRERIRLTTDVKGWVIVSSDNEILDEARGVGMRGIKCADFADMLLRPTKAKLDRGEQPHVMVSEAEIKEFLALFGVDDITDETEIELPPIPGELPIAPVSAPQPVKPKSELPKPPARDIQARKKALAADVEQWLEIFGEEPVRPPTEKAAKIKPRRGGNLPDAEQAEAPAQPAKPVEAAANESLKQSDLLLSSNTVDAWMEVFGEADKEREATDPDPARFEPSKQGRFKDASGKRQPNVHKRMATSEDIYLNPGEVDAWLDVFGVSEDDEDKK